MIPYTSLLNLLKGIIINIKDLLKCIGVTCMVWEGNVCENFRLIYL